MTKTLTKEELAARLDGRQYREEITAEEEKLAKENNLVVIFGASDDLVELRGAIREELGFESVIHLSRRGVPQSACAQGDECPYFRKSFFVALKRNEIKKIPVHWGGEGMDALAHAMLNKPTWCFDCEDLNGKFATFDIFDTDGDDREYFCRGVVIDLSEVFPSRSYEQMVM